MGLNHGPYHPETRWQWFSYQTAAVAKLVEHLQDKPDAQLESLMGLHIFAIVQITECMEALK